MKSVNTLLGLNIYRISSQFIERIRKNNTSWKNSSYFIPTYVFVQKKVHLASYYFQFTSEGQESYIMFDIADKSPLLEIEMSDTGENEFLNDLEIDTFINLLPIEDESVYRKSIPLPCYLVIQLNYTPDSSYDSQEVEFDYACTGFLSEYMNKIPIR